jgi:hypothetical protein
VYEDVHCAWRADHCVEGVEAYPNLSGLSAGVNAISGTTGKYAGVLGANNASKCVGRRS